MTRTHKQLQRNYFKTQGEEKFSKTDLIKAYLQVELHERFRKYLTINTSKGLKRYIRLPYGVKST